jgi:hypothetical protein
MIIAMLVLGAGLAVGANGGAAAGAPSEKPSAVWSFTLENDWAGGTDRNYTAGLKLSRTSKVGARSYLQLGVAQQLYTPAYDYALRPLPDEHPYASVLLGEVRAAFDRPRVIDIVTAQAGAVGENAFGEEVQDGVHNFIGQGVARGWDNQIGNAFLYNLGAERRFPIDLGKVAGLATELTPRIGILAGNAVTAAEGGATLRIGRRMGRPLGEARLLPSSGGIAWHEPGEGGYVYAGLHLRGVAHKVWLDGRSGEEEIVTQPSEELVRDIEAGFSLPILRTSTRISVSYMHRSETFELGEAQGIGALSLSSRF